MMKQIKHILYFAVLVMATSCEIDNYDQPNAELYGTFIDEGTNEPLAQDIINGTVIELIEQGWVEDQTNVTQTLVSKGDGTYQNSQIFSGEYLVRAVRGNFHDIPPIESMEIKGRTELNFLVTPYLRIIDPVIERVGSTVTATFRIEQTSTQEVSRIGLYVHPNPNVGNPMTLTSRVESNINRLTDPSETFSLSIDLDANSSTLLQGNPYYFRIGAVSSAGSAKYNYGPAVRFTI
ncbi:DUF3823 domain-containing protein [Cyclobacterium plantarum]|uniref:DUF3823 domain-containing protein n=1 Tax=Cyclobacterium plantarum TaxID=2716263 RepID=A0ABX0HA26_9BACT|nr:DUF3823 domain-containing protein [Cyclobacterium plantarum]NHE58701.1 DUF3823 domain-containing protein [Cyclobacterium plantarum]